MPFLIIIALVVFSGRALPQRSFLQDRLPELGTGRIRAGWVVAGVAIWIGFCFLFTPSWSDSVTNTMITGMICLSLVVVTGYCGQLSLAQFAIAGVGAFISARIADVYGVPFLPALVIGILGTIPIGLLIALPALRTRGVNLAVVTIGLALSINSLLLNNANFTGGLIGTIVHPPTLFGWSINATTHSNRYAVMCTVIFVLSAIAVANLRRGAAGRRLLAVRANERAAASLGVSVTGAKLYAFGLGAAIAALAGVLLAFQVPYVSFSNYGGLQSIRVVIDSVIGGVGFIPGALIGGTFGDQGVNQEVLGHWGSLANYVTVASGALVILVLIFNQNGLAWNNIQIANAVRTRLGRLASLGRPGADATRAEAQASDAETEIALVSGGRPDHHVPARPRASVNQSRTLRIEDLKVSFGGVKALQGVNLSVSSGEVVGLIGPNGAGKTALLDAISGVNRRYQGGVLLDGETINSWAPHRRSRAGIGRASQSLDLFDQESAIDNLRTASDARHWWAYVTDLVWPVNPPLPIPAREAIHELGIGELLEQRASELSFGRRRLLAIARALAASPTILLLDEPAAGLDDRNTANLGHLIRRLADEWGLGILLVEHDMPLVMSVCDRIVVLNFGHQIAEGTGPEIRADPAVIAAYLGEVDPSTGGPDQSPELETEGLT